MWILVMFMPVLRRSFVSKLLFVLITFIGCSSVLAQTKSDDDLYSPLGELYQSSQYVDSTQARLVLYRTAALEQQRKAAVVRIAINGAYHTSLMEGAHSVICLPAGPITVDLSPVRNSSRVNKETQKQTGVLLSAGKTTYLLVRAANQDHFSVDEATAQADLQGSKEQVHALSRVPDAQACITQPAAPAAETKAVDGLQQTPSTDAQR